jgi:hypothetical protein
MSEFERTPIYEYMMEELNLRIPERTELSLAPWEPWFPEIAAQEQAKRAEVVLKVEKYTKIQKVRSLR